ncbi:hypothetical protein [Sphingomonas sp. LHG3406-1]|uniref:hypothetical protein n=1 Tax=Sphingomonas sp. LHG3406-1 TaxID=2804617 RepID=UPI00262315F3|nr:hypothetical protein [Sphingomonas sp. LHG3406-1]
MFDFDNFPFHERDFETPLFKDVADFVSQEARPHIFVNKLRDRHQSHHVLARRGRPSRELGIPEVGSAISAFEFAAANGLWKDIHVTIDFARMGAHEPAEVQQVLNRWLRCLAEWCREQGIPCAYTYSVEMSASYEYHAHVAVHVPGDSECSGRRLRTKFRKWNRGYTGRRGPHVAKAIKVRGGSEASELGHWIVFSYLVKGFDRTAVLCSGRNSPDGHDVRLGDIIAKSYRDPGPVAVSRRISVSNSLGPARRAIGVPTGLEDRLAQEPDTNWSGFDFERTAPMSAEERLTPFKWKPVHKPFRSTFEDGIYDVRRLYPVCFYEHVTRLHLSPVNEVANDDNHDDHYDLTEALRSLDVD